MKNILKFIYNIEDKGIYRIRTIFGIKITTKPLILSLENKIDKLENKIDRLISKNNYEAVCSVCIEKMFIKTDKNKLKIAFNCDDLLNGLHDNTSRTGIYTVALNIAKILLDKEDIDIYFYTYRTIDIELREYLIKIFENKYIQIISENSNIWFYIDIFYSPANAIPNFIINDYKHIKRYTTQHDIMPVIFPEYYPDYDENHWLHIVLQQSVRDNNYIFAVSENTKKDFLKYNPKFNPNNIITTHLGVDNKFNPKNSTDVNNILNQYNIPKDKKYVFSLCTIEPRKNLIRIIRSFFKFLEKNNINDMVFVMGGTSWGHFIEKFNTEISEYKDKIIKIGYVADEDLPYLYSGAEWFVYTSQYEGFGLPPLEAMACGCPVIVSNNSSLPEVVGDAGITIDYDSDKQHIEAYERYYFNEEYRKEMAQRGLERSKLFSWDKCVNEMLRVMESNLDKNIKNKVRFIKTEDLIYYKIFGLTIFLPRLKTIFSVGKSEDERFTILTIFGIKIALSKE